MTVAPDELGIVIADTSGLIAAFDTASPDSARAFHVLEQAGLIVLSPMVLAELDHVGRRALGHRIAVEMIEDLATQARTTRFAIAAITPDVLDQANLIRRLYPKLRLDLADAVNVTLAADYETDAILTIDRRDFRALTPLTDHKAFRVLPDDLAST
ncbi:PIN domain-containing protein [Nocardia arthritidis]|uniref:PIN domain-containing protein n=1 Tax=Nocardia arthritidis TaxID=228602 RepID=A0A6G9YN73_9NOCA|nr:PIN domain-containing protein [Nocardia arthritidis]QIS14486.1 PIN domain-containing protein [Nocardia arthritidis]